VKTVFKRRLLKSLSLFLALNIFVDVVFPTAAWALTDGPKQPEYSSFEPVATTNMVSDFNGSFTYNLPVVNIPGPSGSGYAMSLSYHSGNTSETEASWVGHGWTLNPGAINRNTQGVPDDYNEGEIMYYNKRKPNITATVGQKLGIEAYSIDLGVDFTYSYNNYRGFGSKLAIGGGIGGGVASLGYSVSGQEPGTWKAESNAGALLKLIVSKVLKVKQAKANKAKDKGTAEKTEKETAEAKEKKKTFYETRSGKAIDKILGGVNFGLNANTFNMSTALNHYSERCFSVNFEVTTGIDPTLLHIGLEQGYIGSLSYIQNEDNFISNKTGLLYSPKEDYSIEKESPYNLRDRYLPIPHKTKDQFIMTGEVLSGGFSLVDATLTQSEVEPHTNNVKIGNAALDMNVGLNIGVGTNVGAGVSSTAISSFDYSFLSSTGVKPYFRFNNDMGGNVVFTNNNEAHSFTSSIDAPHNGLGSADYSNIHVTAMPERAGSVGYIGYSTMDDRNGDVKTKTFSATKDSDALSLVNMTDKSGALISDIYTVNDNGDKLIYGLPVFVNNETQLSVDVLEKGDFEGGVPDIFIKNDLTAETVLGYTNTEAYATSYLLTQISTSDYIDRTLDGPSSDDFGGWTKFAYRNPAYVTSVGEKYFRYRMPYVGLSYHQGERTDREDDLGSCQFGDKEMYYLKYIETKTHIAFFITNKTNVSYGGLTLQGSGNDRHDGIEAPSNGNATKGNTDDAIKRAECLEKIVVYSKADLLGKPLSVVNFEYDYTLSPGVLNHTCNTSGCEHGKLSLKKVWFEYEGVVNAKIAPYEFKYEYKLPTAFIDEDVKDKYASVVNYGNAYTSSDQNPNYHTWAIDGWGNYRKGGDDRERNYVPGVDQGTDAHFDPAAWQLKQIKLPSGGEILIQYEQHDYQYVQDQKAMTMMSLDGQTSDIGFSINPDQLTGIVVPGNEVATQANRVKYAQDLDAYLLKEKIYFKFLYRLMNDPSVSGPVDLNSCKNEYISGFANARAALVDGKVSIVFNDATGGTNYHTPKDVCKWFVKRMIAGKQMERNCALKDVDLFFPGKSASNDLLQVGGKLVSVFGSARNLVADDFDKYLEVTCVDMSIAYSYLRVPVFAAKKGGGVRVKRILMYDQGIEAASGDVDRDEVLYGTEYFYQNEDGLSSGVATNEPQAYREENALVRSLVQRNDPTWKQQMISGIDRETFEGPLGEAILPPPSIGYSRVVTQNIHAGKSNTGYKVSEFYTCKDFPFKAKNSSVRAPGSDKYNIPAVIVKVDVDRRAAAQSYEFILNDMHGKQKSIKIYRGVFDRETFDVAKSTFSEIYQYYGLEEKVKVMDNTGTISDDYLGKEETVTSENRHAKDEYMGMATQFDMSVGLNFPPPVCIFQFSGMGYVAYSLKEFWTAVFNKTISVTAVTKSVTTTKDGITHVQEFKVFNKYTGKPVITDTYDGYDGIVDMEQSPGTHNGIIRSQNIPAHYVYSGMGQKVQNEQMTFTNKPFDQNLNKLSVGTDAKYFIPGDLLVLSSGDIRELYYVDSKQGNDLLLVKLARKFVDATQAITNASVDVKIINSGYTNQLNGDAAMVITYGNSSAIGTSSEVYDGVTNALKTPAHVLSSSVNVFSNQWVSSVVRQMSITDDNNHVDDDYSLGMKGKWRMKSQVVFNTTIKSAVNDTEPGTNRVYNDAGTYTLEPYYFSAANTNPKWIVSSLVNTYSSDGNMLEDQNALGVKSSANFSHNNSVPSYISKNAPFGSCTFQSYEDNANGSSEKAHTGKRSLKLNGNAVSATTDLLVDVPTKKKEILVRFWMNATNDAMNDVNKYVRVNVQDLSNTATVNPKLTKISQVGEWTLYEGVVRGLNNFTDNSFKVSISTLTATPVYIDDFRFQPNESEMVCYAYDANSLRLVATFDDQHFGLLYQYNGEGKLVRKIVETERGVKTISETQYNIPKKAR
jgi:hypothetical protein